MICPATPRSWGWRTAEFTDADRAHYERNAADERFPQSRHFYLCRKKGCGLLPEVYVRYNYITGRQGRSSWQQKPYCRAHGEQLVESKRQKEVA